MAVRDGGFRATLSSIIVMLSACSVIACSTADATAEPPFASPATRVKSAAPSRDPWAAHIAEAAKRFAIPERWIRAVMAVESTGNRTARSPKGAMGLMQIMPKTWNELRRRYGLGHDPWQPRANILAGAAYLREMHAGRDCRLRREDRGDDRRQGPCDALGRRRLAQILVAWADLRRAI